MIAFQNRLTKDLEPILASMDPREKISAYHDMPYAIFRYDPAHELALRQAVTALQTRLENKGKRVTKISLAECLTEALESEAPLTDWFELEKQFGASKAIEDIHSLLAERTPLVDLVASRMPPDPDPKRDVAFIVRTGSLFPVYRTFSLLEQLKGRVEIPTILFYPGDLDGAAGLRFMGTLLVPRGLVAWERLWQGFLRVSLSDRQLLPVAPGRPRDVQKGADARHIAARDAELLADLRHRLRPHQIIEFFAGDHDES